MAGNAIRPRVEMYDIPKLGCDYLMGIGPGNKSIKRDIALKPEVDNVNMCLDDRTKYTKRTLVIETDEAFLQAGIDAIEAEILRLDLQLGSLINSFEDRMASLQK